MTERRDFELSPPPMKNHIAGLGSLSLRRPTAGLRSAYA